MFDQKLQKMNNEILDFLRLGFDEWQQNRWFGSPTMQVYLRTGPRYINGELIRHAVDLANVTVHEQGKQTYTRFLRRLEKVATDCGYEVLFIENVFEERFQKFHLSQGFTLIENTEPVCFFKTLKGH